MAPTGPPIHQGKTSRSSQVNFVPPPRIRRRSEKRPSPVTMPTWRMPIARAGRHSVISIRSVSRNGPTRVSQSNEAPTPDRREDVKRMATASSIHSTCDPMSSIDAHTARGDASITVETRMRGLNSGRGLDRGPQLGGGVFRR